MSRESSVTVRAQVIEARNRQAARYGGTGVHVNAGLSGRALGRHCRLAKHGLRLLETAARRLALSATGYDRVLKVARTIADLTGRDAIHAEHLAEALQYWMME
ncbi:MAG TPA: hypothetical protein VI485_11785 [Vicinamibacterales bacterium]|nr:hypothetical protein [Vicinamibacterales bacterium]